MNRIAPLLQPFIDQSVSIRSIVARGVQLPPGADSGVVFDASADLLVIPADLLFDLLLPAEDLRFTAIAALWPAPSQERTHDEPWRLQRILFDRGLVCIGSVPFAGRIAQCFLASDAVRSLRAISRADTIRGRVSVRPMNEMGRFANQLFQYTYVKLYALRHGLTAEFPQWTGRSLFRLDDPLCAHPDLPRLSFPGFSDDDLDLWQRDDPPIDVDLHGYFQEIPGCFRPHRALLRSIFQLPANQQRGIDAWRNDVSEGGRRTLVAIHVRRGDYRTLQHELPWFYMVPEQWYLDWLRALWPTLVRPILFVATDEPDTVIPAFDEFEMASPALNAPTGAAASLPAHVIDFEILRSADILALCNSSFSRMAAILAPSTQKCFIPSLATQRFVAYEPWIDQAFWERFRDAWRQPGLDADALASATNDNATPIHFDVSDLVLYLIDHATLTGIQRVQCEILRNLLAIAPPGSIRLVVLSSGTDLGTTEASALANILDAVAGGAASRAYVVSGARGLLRRATPCAIGPREIFVTIGAFWAAPGMGRLLQSLKNRGVVIGTLIHDLLPIAAPEYFDRHTTTSFIKGVIEVLTFADFVLTTSEFNRSSIARLLAARGVEGVPVRLLPLARERAHVVPASQLTAVAPALEQTVISDRIQRIIESDYVLCVGTIEVRKNPTYLFHIWKMLLESGRANIPALVFAGRSGWLVRDFLDQLAACNHLGGRIVMVHTATDAELDQLYRHCLLTMFPSFAEGWGLPVGESLAYGKVCLCSAVGGIPEAGGAAADHVDPYNVRDGFDRLTRFLDNPALRRDREREIAGCFVARSWRTVADDFVRMTLDLANRVQTAGIVGAIAAIRLPANQYLPIGNHRAASDANAIDGALSAEVSCISGWRAPGHAGAQAAEPEALLRFRADAPVGARIVVVLRLVAHRHPVRIRIRSGSGAETEVLVAVGAEHAAPLSCEVEADNLVTAHLSSLPAASWRRRSTDWSLAGFLYFEPGRLTAATTGTTSATAGVAIASLHAAADKIEARDDRIALSSISMSDDRRARSLDAFVKATDCWWLSASATRLAEPLFADDADRRLFVSGRAKTDHADLDRTDAIRLIRRCDVFVSTSRFSEGSVFDRSGVWRALGYLQGAPREHLRWGSPESDRLRVDARALAAAPRHDGSFLVFYNGNLHNYYHWLAEGLVGLDVLTSATASLPDVRIALPMSMDIAAVFDHRQTLHEVGLAKRPVLEVAGDLIHVQEAIWIDCDLIQTMPAQYLKEFQKRIAGRYAPMRASEKRRVLLARRGPTRTIANLAQVERMLSEFGFETVYVEGMSMADQIRLFQGAEFIVGAHGAALANLLFCDPGTRVVELMPSFEFRPFFWIISAKLDLVHGIQFCPTIVHQGFEGFQGALDVDTGKLRELVCNVSDEPLVPLVPQKSHG